jgi:predicted cupin superfamily sugar epimerase
MSGDAAGIIAALGLRPHPEGGHFAETFRDGDAKGRGYSTAIYYLLQAGERSHWHRVDAAEVWHFYAGAPLQLRLWSGAGAVERIMLGNDIANGARPQVVVPRNVWQSATSGGGWTLVGCTVAPGFRFEGFEMAPPDWNPTE